MYENQVGVIAVGTVLEHWDGKTHEDRYYYPSRDKGFNHEYRIKVNWFLDLSREPITIQELKSRIASTPGGAIRRIVKRQAEIESMIDERRALSSSQNTLTEDLKTLVERKIESTTKEALVSARVGQGESRFQVLKLWGNCCSVTRSATLDAIRASHIKPWRKSTDEERLDPNNGLALIASLDAIFDAGLISFDSSGGLIVSSKLNTAERQIFCLGEASLTKKPTPKTADYLDYHRSFVFRG